MSNELKKSKQKKQFQNQEEQYLNLEDKLEDLVLLLNKSELDNDGIEKIRLKLNNELDRMKTRVNAIEEIKTVSLLDIDDFEKLDKLEILLNSNYIDSKSSKKAVVNNILLKIVRLVIGFLMITLGFAMIVMPTPHSFEMFTIFWFNPNDGVTLMDVISLIIIAVGTYVVLKSYTKINF